MSYLINLAERGQNTLLGAELVERGERIREQLAIYAELQDKRLELAARWEIRSGTKSVIWQESWGERPTPRTDSYAGLDDKGHSLADEAWEILATLAPLLSNEEV